jgi:hypothetical protein
LAASGPLPVFNVNGAGPAGLDLDQGTLVEGTCVNESRSNDRSKKNRRRERRLAGGVSPAAAAELTFTIA